MRGVYNNSHENKNIGKYSFGHVITWLDYENMIWFLFTVATEKSAICTFFTWRSYKTHSNNLLYVCAESWTSLVANKPRVRHWWLLTNNIPLAIFFSTNLLKFKKIFLYSVWKKKMEKAMYSITTCTDVNVKEFPALFSPKCYTSSTSHRWPSPKTLHEEITFKGVWKGLYLPRT